MRTLWATTRVVAMVATILGIGLWSVESHGARYAVLVSNNQGWASETRLRYAHLDATRMAATFRELGGFHPSNVFLVKDASPAVIRATLGRVAARVRAGQPSAGRSMLVFYYSGHADERALHPGRGSLSYGDLKAALAAVPTDVRISFIDSCKSGSMTRLKGARRGPSFDVTVTGSGRVSGDVFLTSATESENAQESDRLKGSFFSSYVNTGLRGAADTNHNGRVTLSEIYIYAYKMTVGRTSDTRGGTQHPAYRFNLRGRGELVLTVPSRARACLTFDRGPARRRYLVLEGRSRALVAEVQASSTRRVRLGLPRGRYRVRRRTPAGVFELRVAARGKSCIAVSDSRMLRVDLSSTSAKGDAMAGALSLGVAYSAVLSDLDEPLPVHHLTVSMRFPIPIAYSAARSEPGEDLDEPLLLDPVTGPRGAPFLFVSVRPYLQYGRLRREGWVAADKVALGLGATLDVSTRLGLVGAGPVVAYHLLLQDSPVVGGFEVSGLLVGAMGSWAIPLPWWRLAASADLRVGDAMYGFPRHSSVGETVHRFHWELSAGLNAWW